jgi:signal transduction histidine kinase
MPAHGAGQTGRMHDATDTHGGRWWRALWRPLPLVVLTVLVAATVAASLIVHRVVAEQEKRLLRERTAEVALILQNSISTLGSSMRTLAVAADLRAEAPDAFARVARAQAATSPGQTIRLVRRDGSGFRVVDGAGPAPQPGMHLDGARLAVVRRAIAARQLASSPVFHVAGTRMLAFALGPPAARPGTAIQLETPLPRTNAAVADRQPFHELEVAFYAGPAAARRDLLLATTTDTPLSGDTASKTVPVGSSRWLLVARSHDPLAGTFAHWVPWVILAGGLLASLLITGAVVALGRRRDYAVMVADERTRELRASLRELGHTQQRLVAQERLAAIGQLAAGVGHELRNPLGVVTNALYLLRSTVTPEQEARVGRHIETAEREVIAAATIVESLLDFARERAPVTGAVDLADVLEEALSVAPPPPEVSVERRGLDELPAALVDRQQLRQVILNLLTNAYEAMPDGGTLTIEAETIDERVELRVSDTGTGMDEETRSHIFDPFYTRKVKGIGLGLAVSRRIVELHGGSITAESEPGHGATFALSLPLATAAEPEPVLS